jgi:hypothetical protein
MLSNVMDVEEAMANGAAQGEEAMAFFFDYASAFPSIEQELLHKFFQHLGWPSWLLRAIKARYWNNFCSICMGGSRFNGFDITRGIRQGCPLSPLLFAIATDLMLRRLGRRFPGSCARSYADDLAMVIKDGVNSLGRLEEFFIDFQAISGLQLNIKKTVIIPLWEYEEQNVKDIFIAKAPRWEEVKISHSAKYLGFYVGPKRGELSWKAPLEKFLERAKLWGKLGLGFMITVQAYQVYISSVIQFVAQLEDLPHDFNDYERRATQALLHRTHRVDGAILPEGFGDARHVQEPRGPHGCGYCGEG